MTNIQLWDRYKEYSRDITEHERKLGFAGAGICWILRGQDFTFPALIYVALFFIVGYFIADLLQGFSAALIYRCFIHYHEVRLLRKTGSHDGDIIVRRWLDWPAFGCFIIKSILLLIGFVFIGLYIRQRLAH